MTGSDEGRTDVDESRSLGEVFGLNEELLCKMAKFLEENGGEITVREASLHFIALAAFCSVSDEDPAQSVFILTTALQAMVDMVLKGGQASAAAPLH